MGTKNPVHYFGSGEVQNVGAGLLANAVYQSQIS